jgi:hypothetical protein
MVAEPGSVGTEDVMKENEVVNMPVVLLPPWKKLWHPESPKNVFEGKAGLKRFIIFANSGTKVGRGEQEREINVLVRGLLWVNTFDDGGICGWGP